jgi:hypothetical protein
VPFGNESKLDSPSFSLDLLCPCADVTRNLRPGRLKYLSVSVLGMVSTFSLEAARMDQQVRSAFEKD